jgi:L-asparaginase
MSLRIIATGGTFDKHYDEIAGALTFNETHLAAVIQRARITVPVVLEVSMLIDSLAMDDMHRQTILSACERAPESSVVIIHGTDTMPETAQVLGAAFLNKTIVLTGAMIPYEIANSDALFNFGYAIGAAQLLPHGVYVAMNGQVFAWDAVRKDKAAGVFVALK